MSVYRWNLCQCDTGLVARLVRELGVSPLVARCLLNRRCQTTEEAQLYLEPKLAHLRDPFLLPNMELAVERLFRAHRDRERIVLFGDYDVDGVTSTALLTRFFGQLGWLSVYYLPHRMEEGYGLSMDAVSKCLERFDPQLFIAVDCGSSSREVIRWLSDKGIDTIVLDHHQVCDPPPEPCAFVNPHLGADEPSRDFCSAGLAFKLAHAILKRGRILGWSEAAHCDLKDFLDLVALGTIADIVPLRGENRILAKTGLERIRRTSRPGLAALTRVAGLQGDIGCHEVGYQLGPRLNAAGRLETALDALELLLTDDAARAAELAAALNEQNRARQEIEKRMVEEVLQEVRTRFNSATDFAIVEGRADWHIGVVGIVASRVQREFYRPTIVFGGDGPDRWRGSGRSVPGFDLAAGLRNCGQLLLKSGGHAMAAGLTMAASNVNELRSRLNALVKESLNETGLRPVLDLDGEVRLAELNFESMKALEHLQPVGHGNPPVQFVARQLTLRGEPRLLGSEQQHRKFTVTDGVVSHQAVWWNYPGNRELPRTFDLAFAPELNEYNGSVGLQLRVLDLDPKV